MNRSLFCNVDYKSLRVNKYFLSPFQTTFNKPMPLWLALEDGRPLPAMCITLEQSQTFKTKFYLKSRKSYFYFTEKSFHLEVKDQ